MQPDQSSVDPGTVDRDAAEASLGRRAAAEVLGTFWLVLGGVGTAVLAGRGVGPLGISIAFGLAVLSMAYAVGPLSGALFNPAVSVGLYAAGRIPVRDWLVYTLAQVVGAIVGAGVVYALAAGLPGGYDASARGLAANGYGAHSPGSFSLGSAFVAELLLTFGFVLVILGVTAKRALNSFAGPAIGLCLTLVHLIAIPITNTSVNPARSTGPAIFVGGWAISQLWLFWVAPLFGALLAGILARLLFPHEARFMWPRPTPTAADRERARVAVPTPVQTPAR